MHLLTSARKDRSTSLRLRLMSALAAGVAFASAAAAAPPPEKVALTGGRIIPIVGEEIESGTILIERGRITAVGTDVEIPYDAMEVDCSGKVLMPGMIDPHSSDGLDVGNERLPVTPFLDVYDAIDPSRSYFEDALREGVTSVHVIVGNDCVIGGVSRIVRPIGLSIDEMSVQPDVALKLSTSPQRDFDRMRQLATLRETFADLDDYLRDLAESKYEASLERDGETLDVGPDEAAARGRSLLRDADYDDRHRNLVRLRRGDLAAWIYCGSATDVRPAVELARDQEFFDSTVLVLGPETWRALGELVSAGRPVVLDRSLVHRERDPITGELEETFIPKKIHDAGLTFALQPNARGSLAERYLNYQAAMCVRYGIPRQTALEAITINPARMLGVDDRLGSIEVGKVANIVVFSGDPLDFSSWVDRVYISGVEAYDRAQDPRLQKLLELENRIEAAAATAAEATDESSDDAAEGEGGSGGEGDGGGGGDQP